MPRTVRTFLPLTGEPAALAAAFSADPERWLPDAHRAGPDRWSMTVRAGAFARTVTATVGSPWRAGATVWRMLSWEPESEVGDPVALDRLLPSLDAEVGLHLEAPGRTTIVLDARYQPPGGVFGTAVDVAGLHRVAQATVDRLLRDVAARLTAEGLLVSDGPEPDGSGAVAADGDLPDERRTATTPS